MDAVDVSPSQDIQHSVTRCITTPPWMPWILVHHRVPIVQHNVARSITTSPWVPWMLGPSQDTQHNVTWSITTPPQMPWMLVNPKLFSAFCYVLLTVPINTLGKKERTSSRIPFQGTKRW